MSYGDYDLDAATHQTRIPAVKVGTHRQSDVGDYTPTEAGPYDNFFQFQDAQTIAMSDAAVTLTHRRAASATQLTSNVLYVDPESSGASEALKMPPEADSDGDVIFIANTGGEGVAVQNDAAGAILTIPAGEAGVVWCDGTTWRGFIGFDSVTATGAEINKLDGIAATAYLSVTEGISFTEDGSGTSYIGTITIPAGAVIEAIQVFSTALWDGTSATMIVGDGSDDNGYFTGINLKATDLLVGEVLDTSDSTNWGGKEGAYLVAASGTRNKHYQASADSVIGKVTPGAADGSAGRTFMVVRYCVPTFVASTNT